MTAHSLCIAISRSIATGVCGSNYLKDGANAGLLIQLAAITGLQIGSKNTHLRMLFK
jgi:hypothetical protein